MDAINLPKIPNDPNKKNVAVIYHDKCVDGFGAALAAWIYFRQTREGSTYNEPEFIPGSYGAPIPFDRILSDSEVFILDFSYPKADMEELAQKTKLVVLDHHKTAKENLLGMNFAKRVLFDMDKSGAVLAWEHFFPKEEVPTVFKYIQDRDLWKWELRNGQAIGAFLAARPKDFYSWAMLVGDNFDKNFNEYVRIGENLLAARDLQVQEIIDSGVEECSLAGFKTVLVNTSVLQSEVCNYLYSVLYPDLPFVGCYFRTKKGEWRFSLRSNNKKPEAADVSIIAQGFGGGGHKNAAGFGVKRIEQAVSFNLPN